MQLSLYDIFIITVVSMGIVFIILIGIMYMMKLTAFIVTRLEKRTQPLPQTVADADVLQTDLDLFTNDKNAKIAVITALAIASQEENKTYKIESVRKADRT